MSREQLYLRWKFRAGRADAGLAPDAMSERAALPVGCRVRGRSVRLEGLTGTVGHIATGVLPPGQMMVRFDQAVIGRLQRFAVLPEEVERLLPGSPAMPRPDPDIDR